MSTLSSQTMPATFFSSIPYISLHNPPFFSTLSLNLWVLASAYKLIAKNTIDKEDNQQVCTPKMQALKYNEGINRTVVWLSRPMVSIETDLKGVMNHIQTPGPSNKLHR